MKKDELTLTIEIIRMPHDLFEDKERFFAKLTYPFHRSGGYGETEFEVVRKMITTIEKECGELEVHNP